MAKENECYAYFTVTGSFDPDDISQRVGMAPTDRWRKGDVNPQTQCARSESRWIWVRGWRKLCPSRLT